MWTTLERPGWPEGCSPGACCPKFLQCKCFLIDLEIEGLILVSSGVMIKTQFGEMSYLIKAVTFVLKKVPKTRWMDANFLHDCHWYCVIFPCP